MNAYIIEKTIAYGKIRYRTDSNGNWKVLMFGSHGPSDPSVGLSWKWYRIPESKVPKDVKKEGIIK